MLGMGRVSRAAFSLTVENRQHLGHFRCPPHVALKNLVVNRGRSPPSTRRLLTRGARTSQVPLPVTSFCAGALPLRTLRPSPVIVRVAVPPDVLIDFRLERLVEHLQRTALQELVQLGPQFLVFFRRLLG
jgi:hypothetical protein